MFIIENQLILLIAFFASGCLGTAFLLRKPAGHRGWLVADLVWVVLGGFGALVAVLAGTYKADSSQIDRQIDVAFAATASFDRDAARFRLRYCETPAGDAVAVLCDKADFLSASTAENSDLPLFIAITDQVSPLQSLSFFGSRDKGPAMTETMETANQFDPDQLLIFATLDDATTAALTDIQSADPTLAADFRILASSYDTLIEQVSTLKEEWDYLQQNAYILLIQIIAICLVSFAAPFRLGKSVVELISR